MKGFLVDKGTPGYAAEVIGGKIGLRGLCNAHMTLTDVRVPEAQRLPGARSFKDAGAVLSSTRNVVAWAALGHVVSAYEAAIAYAKERTQSGKPLVAFQMIQEKLVTMLADLAAMQLYCLRLGRLIEEGHLSDTIAALAKLHHTVKAREICRTAREILGGDGLLLENHVVRHMADMEPCTPTREPAEIQTLIVGRYITGDSAFV